MLLQCPECELQVSDKALTCPHCGFPLNSQISKRSKTKRKHKRLPNGFGQITELKDKNLRNPYRAMVTVGKSDTGKPICKLLKPQAYFPTYNAAYTALVEYNQNPYDISNIITVNDLYERWSEEYFKTLANASSIRSISSAWAYCKPVYNMEVRDLRARHIKGCMDETTSPNIKGRIKSLFNLMLDYALEYEMVDKNYARTFNISSDVLKEKEEMKRGHIIFNEKELNTLWEHVDDVKYVDVILIQCYMGWRPQELGLIERKNISLVDDTIIGGMKTEAGTNRTVPIHPKIRPLIVKLYQESSKTASKYLITCTDGQTHRNNTMMTYDKYQKRFNKVRDLLELNKEHRPHDGRKTFVSMCKNSGVDEYAIKMMVGHAISDITEKVYTERKSDWLKEEVLKIK